MPKFYIKIKKLQYKNSQLKIKKMESSILTPFVFIAAPFLAAGLLIETFVFWMFTAKNRIGFWKSFFGVLLANVTTVVLTFFISFYSSNDTNLIWFLVAFAVALIIEWLVYIILFQKYKINFKLLVISFVGNLITYVVIGYLFFFKTGMLNKYLENFQ